ncbi:hypothetical protein LNP25_28090 [Klebsiella variicola subsp. variicola]|nr:hypothetical protein [Klebsiella variicola subsp. variicola]
MSRWTLRFFDQWITSILAPLRQAINLLKCVLDAEMAVVGGMMPAPLLEKVLRGQAAAAVISLCAGVTSAGAACRDG